MLPKVSVAICLLAALATLFLILPGEYCQLTTPTELLHVLVIAGPYLFLALLSWRHRGNQRTSRALLILNVLLALAGLGIFAAEASGYHAEVARFVARDPHRGKEFILARLQRTALFAVPALQWFVSLIAAGALLVQRRPSTAQDATP